MIYETNTQMTLSSVRVGLATEQGFHQLLEFDRCEYFYCNLKVKNLAFFPVALYCLKKQVF